MSQADNFNRPVPITEPNWPENFEPLVSISCITYNHENYIRDAIEGFLMQKTTFPVEILIHDDASTDNTAQIVREYEVKYPQLIKPIYQTENQYSKRDGTIGKLQRGRAKGKYYAPCEGDDYWTDPYKLQKQVVFLEENPKYSLCFHNATVIYEGRLKKPHSFTKLNKNEYDIGDVIEKNWFIPTNSILYRKDLYENQPWAKYVFGGDYALQLMLATKGLFYGFNESMSIYRVNNTGISTKQKPGFHQIRIVESLSYFNLSTNFRYNLAVKKRINKIINNLPLRITLGQPLWKRLLTPNYYIYALKKLLKKQFNE